MGLPKAKNYLDELDFTESGNWNNAKAYAELMIMRYLDEADHYERVAQFGMSNFDERFMINEAMIIRNRLDAMEWLINTLIKIIDNSLFAIKSKDKDKFRKYRDFLVDIKEIFPNVRQDRQEYSRKIMGINEEKFSLVLRDLTRIRSELNEPLNRADLIFSHKEEFDPKAFKEKVKDRLINVG